ncbi:hypothetical protein DRW07_13175 [Alteromonas sediminis]|uniref:Lipopolysaccharide heptosyltransferase family protein n=2 Tax=Alteromonas sediminis TaxID=2259342 RepID=A0A3N5XY06_9ALTE|nr:hypothetical protein DRW07_13175 [Alteromonas sediminis]
MQGSQALQPLISHAELMSAKRILFMSHLALGDFVYHGPYLAALKANYPHLELDIWFDDNKNRSKGWKSERNEALTERIKDSGIATVIFPVAGSNDERQKLIRRGNRRQYDIIFYFSANRSLQFAKLAKQIASTAIIVGNTPPKAWLNLREYAYYRHVKRKFVLDEVTGKRELVTHIFDRCRERYERCFGPLKLHNTHKQGLPVNTTEKSRGVISAWISQQVSDHSSPLVLLNPFSGSQKQDLSAEAFTSVINAIFTHYEQAHIIVNVPASSEIGVKAVLKAHELNQNSQISLFTQSDNIHLLPALLQQVDFIVTVESAITHFASTLHCPQLAIVRENAASRRPIEYVDLFWCPERIHNVRGIELAPKVISAMRSLKL